VTPSELDTCATDANRRGDALYEVPRLCQGPPAHAQHAQRARVVWARGASHCRGEGVTSQHLGDTWSRRALRRAEGRPRVTEWPSWGRGAPRPRAKGAGRPFCISERRRKPPLEVLPPLCHLAGHLPSWAPRTMLCKTDIDFRPLWRRRTRWWRGASHVSFVDPRRSPFRAPGRASHARSRAKRAPANSSPRVRGAVSADLDVLWCLARAIEAARPPQQ
jgi:hypothetical protein